MENSPIERRKVVVTLKSGLHMRPMSLIAKVVKEFSGEVYIRREDGYAVNAKSMFDLLTLGAEYGTPLMLEAQGDAAGELLDYLETLFDSKFGWDEDEDDFSSPSPPPSMKKLDSCRQPVEGE